MEGKEHMERTIEGERNRERILQIKRRTGWMESRRKKRKRRGRRARV